MRRSADPQRELHARRHSARTHGSRRPGRLAGGGGLPPTDASAGSRPRAGSSATSGAPVATRPTRHLRDLHRPSPAHDEDLGGAAVRRGRRSREPHHGRVAARTRAVPAGSDRRGGAARPPTSRVEAGGEGPPVPPSCSAAAPCAAAATDSHRGHRPRPVRPDDHEPAGDRVGPHSVSAAPDDPRPPAGSAARQIACPVAKASQRPPRRRSRRRGLTARALLPARCRGFARTAARRAQPCRGRPWPQEIPRRPLQAMADRGGARRPGGAPRRVAGARRPQGR